MNLIFIFQKGGVSYCRGALVGGNMVYLMCKTHTGLQKKSHNNSIENQLSKWSLVVTYHQNLLNRSQVIKARNILVLRPQHVWMACVHSFPSHIVILMLDIVTVMCARGWLQSLQCFTVKCVTYLQN